MVVGFGCRSVTDFSHLRSSKMGGDPRSRPRPQPLLRLAMQAPWRRSRPFPRPLACFVKLARFLSAPPRHLGLSVQRKPQPIRSGHATSTPWESLEPCFLSRAVSPVYLLRSAGRFVDRPYLWSPRAIHGQRVSRQRNEPQPKSGCARGSTTPCLATPVKTLS